jgi:hypothetical protein
MNNILRVFADNPLWFINDMLVVILFIATVFFIINNEKTPTTILLEGAAFVFLYSVIFDNIGVNYLRYYEYGRSILMFGGVIISMPLTEWMVLYYTLRLLGKANVPVWISPFIVGLFGFFQDLTLDPVAIRQVTDGAGRWTWHMGPGWAQYLGIPLFNLHGWFLVLFCSTITFTIGRYLYKKSGYKPAVGYLYPILGALAALGMLFSPLSSLFIDATYPLKIGAAVEWITLSFWSLIGFIGILIWRFRMKSPLTFPGDWPIFIIPTVLHVADITGALILGVAAVTINSIVVTVIHLAIVFGCLVSSPKMAVSPVQ